MDSFRSIEHEKFFRHFDKEKGFYRELIIEFETKRSTTKKKQNRKLIQNFV